MSHALGDHADALILSGIRAHDVERPVRRAVIRDEKPPVPIGLTLNRLDLLTHKALAIVCRHEDINSRVRHTYASLSVFIYSASSSSQSGMWKPVDSSFSRESVECSGLGAMGPFAEA